MISTPIGSGIVRFGAYAAVLTVLVAVVAFLLPAFATLFPLLLPLFPHFTETFSHVTTPPLQQHKADKGDDYEK